MKSNAQKTVKLDLKCNFHDKFIKYDCLYYSICLEPRHQVIL